MRMSERSVRARRWISWGALAVLDQGLISGSNFALAILLARWSNAEEYGAYAVAFGIFVLVSQLYQATVLEPMSVFGGSVYHEQLPEYAGILVWIHTILSLGSMAVFGIGVAVAYLFGATPALTWCLGALTLSSPLVLLMWMARRAKYLELSPSLAALGAALYCGVVLGGMVLIRKWYVLSASMAFMLMGAAALLTGILLMLSSRPVLSLRRNRLSLREVMRRHWEYGRWALGSSLAIWVPNNIFYFIVPAFGGVAAAANLRALMNLTLPPGQTATALQLLLQPHTAKVHHTRGNNALKSVSVTIAGVLFLGSAVYWGILVAFGKPILHALYAGRYDSVTNLLPWLAVGVIAQTLNSVPTLGLRALQRPSDVLAAYSAAVVVTLVAGIPLTWRWGVSGVVITMLISNVTTSLVGARLFNRHLKATPIIPQEAAA
jgi:O-antigen/teichoic acid export membrane protein